MMVNNKVKKKTENQHILFSVHGVREMWLSGSMSSLKESQYTWMQTDLPRPSLFWNICG